MIDNTNNPRRPFLEDEMATWPEGYRKCTDCTELLPFTNFYRQTVGWRGYTAICKVCIKPRNKKLVRARSTTKKLFTSAKQRAKAAGIPFNITEEDIVVPDICPALGITLKHNHDRVGPDSPTLDRIIPSKGYVRGNIAVISHKANLMKNNGSLDELISLVNWLKSVN